MYVSISVYYSNFSETVMTLVIRDAIQLTVVPYQIISRGLVAAAVVATDTRLRKIIVSPGRHLCRYLKLINAVSTLCAPINFFLFPDDARLCQPTYVSRA